jgi:hypothetical protein
MQKRAIAAMVLVLTACGGGASQAHTTTSAETDAPPPPPPATAAHARGESSVTARVGRMGGSLELANGARLEIDPNVLGEEVEITMRTGEPAHVFDTAETQTPLGPLVDIEPAVTPSQSRSIHYSVPFTRIPAGYPESDLALAVEEAGSQREHFVSATQTRWQMYAARHIGDRFVADLDELAGHRLQFGVSR